MGKTTIEWTDWSTNPIRAGDPMTEKTGHHCEKVSKGCANCYSERLQPRIRGQGKFIQSERNRLEHFLDENVLQQVMRRRKPTRIFWCDMTDMFGAWVQDTWIDRCLAVMALTPQHTHQVLTKRIDRAADYLNRDIRRHEVANQIAYFVRDADWRKPRIPDGPSAAALYEGVSGGWRWPLNNLWMGTSVEDQEAADERVSHLLRCPAAIRFLSCEPLLGDINLAGALNDCRCGKCDYCRDIADHPTRAVDWCIVGVESGPRRRETKVEWIESIQEQCMHAKAAFFNKQMSIDGRVCKDIAEFPAGLQIRQFPKAA